MNHDLMMPHDARYSLDSIHGCPPNCPALKDARYNVAKVANGEVKVGDTVTYGSSHGHVSIAEVTEVVFYRNMSEYAGRDDQGNAIHRLRTYYKIKVEILQSSEVDLSHISPRFSAPRKRRTLSDLHKVLRIELAVN